MSVDLKQLFRSTEEVEVPVKAKIQGDFPEWINGNFYRLGPGKFDISDEFSMNHWVDGYAVVYKFCIKNKQVEFMKKFIQSDAYKKAISIGKPIYGEFGTKAYPDPTKNLFTKIANSIVPDLTDNVGANLVKISDTLIAATESQYVRSVEPSTLETGSKIDIGKSAGVNFCCSHMLCDSTGDAYGVGTSVTTGLKFVIFKIPSGSHEKFEDAIQNVKTIATIPSQWKSSVCFYHSFGLSKNWIVFIEQPLQMNVMKLITASIKGKCMKDCMDWSPKDLNRFHVIEKSTGKVIPIKFKSAKPFFLFHHINTYEENNQLVIDVIAHDSPEVVDKMLLDNLRCCSLDLVHKAEARRFVIPLANDIADLPENVNLVTLQTGAKATRVNDIVEVEYELLTPPGYELPKLNRSFYGKKYKYFYACGLYDESKFKSSIVKVDTETGSTVTWKHSETSFPGEVEFIPRPNSSREDDGVLISAVTDLRPGQPDFLVVLDATSMTEIARANVDAHVPNLLHTLFLPS